MASDDDDRTVFGQKLPPQPPKAAPQPQGQPPERPPAQQPAPAPPPPPQAPAPPQPPYQPHPAAPPPSGPQGGPPPGVEDTWFGGRLPPQPAPAQQPYPPQQPAYAPPPGQPQPPYPPQAHPGYPPAQPGYPPPNTGYPYHGQQPPAAPQPGWTPAAPPVDHQFPGHVPQQTPQPRHDLPKIAFDDALRGKGLDIGDASNPIIGAASDLLMLLGRLRTGMVEMQAIPLHDHVRREIATFVQNCQGKGIAPDDIEVARYALAATADDIVQTIPGNDPQYWQQFSMAAELLNDRSAGIGFFARLEEVIAFPQQRGHVLELMLTCLALGFEGKYRADPNGPVMLSRLRQEVYHRLRAVTPRVTDEMSHKWVPVVLGGRRSGANVPMWVFGAIGGAMVVALFATLTWILAQDAQAAQNDIISLHADATEVVIERSQTAPEFVPYEAAATGQLERIQGRLAPEIADGVVEVEEYGDFIAIRLRDALRFGSASAELTSDISALGERIAQVLEPEQGEIIIEGHSDNVPLSGRGQYRTNEALSEARAETVRALLVPHLSDPARMSVIGIGPAKPLNTANSPEARAENRRVEILLRKEQSL
ncbi:type VI secretion system protein ImpK [Yoonia maricola]|uniref:Type VI secretion system protein ImpK n=1 Tax=Yoonia maricola TaxID=420999 RepID=A0A2M8VZX9_9RHOB|nr:type IVB secretion system protein IcmH/DotU [Yoonia maricola]PJI84226.1 type VI secretion system protein ImpK [Yoonia maricola]